jgi:hypothetical protein
MAILKNLWVLSTLICLCAPVDAQPKHPFNGRWRASFAGDQAANRTALVELKDAGGTYEASYKGVTNKCAGMRNSIEVKVISEQEIEIEVLRKKASRICDDTTIRLTKKDENTLEGKITAGWLGDGRSIKLVRE